MPSGDRQFKRKYTFVRERGVKMDLDDEELKATRILNGADTREHKVYAIKFAVMQKQIDEKDKRIKDLEEENVILRKANNITKDLIKEVKIEDITQVINKSYEEFVNQFIAKQKVKDKIEKYNRKMEEDVGHPNWIIADKIVINVLQELLEGGKRF